MGIAGVALIGLAMLPLLAVVAEVASLRPDPGASHPEFPVLGWIGIAGFLMLRSLGIALPVTALALAIGVPLGLLLGRCDVPARRIILVLHAFPMFLPPFLLGLGWFYLLGRQGLLGSETTSSALFGPAGVISVLTLAFTPIVTTLVALAASGVDPALDEAARLVASPRRVLTRILFPLTWPAAALGALIVFALAFSELGVPMFLRVRAYPAAVLARLGGIDYAPGEAVALVLPLAAIALGLVELERHLARRWSFPALAWRTGNVALPLAPGRVPAAVAASVVAALSLLPLVGLAVRATGSFAAVWDWLGGSLWNSLFFGVGGATVIVMLGIVLGHAIGRRRPGSAFMDGIAVLSFVTPAALLGVGLVALWNRPATQPVYTSGAIVILGFSARYAFVGIRTVATGVAQSSPHTEEAAALAGAGFLRRLVRIVAPEHARAILGAWFLALVFCLRDLETAVLFYPPGREPLSVRIFTLEANGPEPVVAALAIVQILLTAVVLLAASAVFWRRRAA